MRAAQRHERDVTLCPRLEAHRRPRRDVQPEPARRRAIERERRVDRRELEVRADLDRPVARVHHPQDTSLAARVELEFARSRDHLARNHAIGSCRVTSLRPSGNVASTCTSATNSGTPSITSARDSTDRPSAINDATERPSRARSITQHESSATASGWFNFTPRSNRSRATIPATASSNLAWSDGVSNMAGATLTIPAAARNWTAGEKSPSDDQHACPLHVLGRPPALVHPQADQPAEVRE